jgi:hypothetical protein
MHRIGRLNNCDLSLPDNSVSRVHCCLYIENSQLVLENNSKYGTKVLIQNPKLNIVSDYPLCIETQNTYLKIFVKKSFQFFCCGDSTKSYVRMHPYQSQNQKGFDLFCSMVFKSDDENDSEDEKEENDEGGNIINLIDNNDNDNNENINYEKNKENIATKKFIDAAGRVINDENAKKDKNNVIKEKTVYSEIKKENISNEEKDNNINKQKEDLKKDKINEDKKIEISSRNDNINNIVEEISRNEKNQEKEKEVTELKIKKESETEEELRDFPKIIINEENEKKEQKKLN